MFRVTDGEDASIRAHDANPEQVIGHASQRRVHLRVFPQRHGFKTPMSVRYELRDLI
jgi:hypothetical protein